VSALPATPAANRPAQAARRSVCEAFVAEVETKCAVALAGLAAAALVIAVVLVARGDESEASASRDCALA
jgi:hypothetical protein